MLFWELHSEFGVESYRKQLWDLVYNSPWCTTKQAQAIRKAMLASLERDKSEIHWRTATYWGIRAVLKNKYACTYWLLKLMTLEDVGRRPPDNYFTTEWKF
jgi:hypothetical protein